MKYYFDYLFYGKEKISLRGWTCGEKETQEIKVFAFQKKPDSFDFEKGSPEIFVNRKERPDVAKTVFGKESAVKFEFSLEADVTGGEDFHLVFYHPETREKLFVNCKKEFRKRFSVWNYLKSKNKADFILQKTCGDLDPIDRKYHLWYLKNRISAKEWMKQRKEKFYYSPKVSVLIPVYRPIQRQLEEALNSIYSQSYENYEIVLSNGCPEDEKTVSYLKSLSEKNEKIKVVFSSVSAGISENTNRALKEASGEWAALLDQDDLFAPNALYEFVKAVFENPRAEVFYSDEDKIIDEKNIHVAPNFKTPYNEARLLSDNYICHLLFFKRESALQIGGERKELDGAQDYDFTIRLIHQAKEKPVHIPKILYHWRVHKDSTSGGVGIKEYAIEAGRKAVENALNLWGYEAKAVHSKIPGRYELRPALKDFPLISVLIPTKDHTDDLRRTLESLYRCSYPNFETILIENNSEDYANENSIIRKEYERLKNLYPNLQVVRYEGTFNYSAINNFGRKFAHGEYLLLLNNDLKIISEDFMESLLLYGKREDTGAVGAKLFYEDDTIQHAGVLVGADHRICHVYAGMPGDFVGHMGRLASSNDVTAVTGAALLTRTSLFDLLGGLAEELPVAYNDIDYCLRVRREGFRVVYDNFACAYHYESKSRGAEDTSEKKERLENDFRIFEKRNPGAMDSDPYYNPNLTTKDNRFYEVENV